MLDCKDLVGVPYAHAGRGPDSYDCYGLLIEIYRRQGITLKDYRCPKEQQQMAANMMLGVSNDWETVPRQIGSSAWIRIGRFPSHCAYVISDLFMIHSWEQSCGVMIERIRDWEPRILGYYKPLPQV